ncbi:MAG: transposase [Gammaproteobacteria bacterium]
MTRRIRNYTKEFKQEAVNLALNSSSVTQAAKDLGMPKATLHTWVLKAKRHGEVSHAKIAEPINVGKIMEENQRLKKQLARLEQEKAILKKAAAA